MRQSSYEWDQLMEITAMSQNTQYPVICRHLQCTKCLNCWKLQSQESTHQLFGWYGLIRISSGWSTVSVTLTRRKVLHQQPFRVDPLFLEASDYEKLGVCFLNRFLTNWNQVNEAVLCLHYVKGDHQKVKRKLCDSSDHRSISYSETKLENLQCITMGILKWKAHSFNIGYLCFL